MDDLGGKELGAAERFLAPYSGSRLRRARSELRRVEKASARMGLGQFRQWTEGDVSEAATELAREYSEDAAKATLKQLRAFLRFLVEEQELAEENAKKLEAKARLPGRGLWAGAVFPMMIDSVEAQTPVRAARDSALVALWAGTTLSWRALATLELTDPRIPLEVLQPWLARWIEVRGREPGPLLCKIVEGVPEPGVGDQHRSIQGRVEAHLAALGLSGARGRSLAAESFSRWRARA